MTILISHSYSCYRKNIKRKFNTISAPPQQFPIRKHGAKQHHIQKKCRATTPNNLPPTPELQLEIMTIYINGQEFEIIIPYGYDIYEWTRVWYPHLYKAALEEEKNYRYEDYSTGEEVSETDYEAAWAQHDYMEWVHD